MYEYAKKRGSNWLEDLETGAKTEELFKNFVTNLGMKCTDVSKDKKYQDIDVDFVVYNPFIDMTTLVEVKRDYNLDKYSYNCNRFCIENISSIYVNGSVANTDGWYKKTGCDIIAFHDSKRFMYLYRMDDIREYIEKYKDGYASRVIYYKLGNSRCYGLIHKKFDEWLIDNNKFGQVFDLNSNVYFDIKDYYFEEEVF